MFTPRLAAGPVSAPKNANSRSHACPPEALPPLLPLLQPAARSATTPAAATARLMCLICTSTLHFRDVGNLTTDNGRPHADAPHDIFVTQRGSSARGRL